MAKGSTISVSLFAIKINSLSKVIPKEIHASMFVDDVQIAYSHRDINQLQSVLQKTVNNIANWANNGFTFSTSKTVMMQFYTTRVPLLQPKIYLNNKLIPEMSTVKFLRLVWYPKLTWIPHIAKLKDKCVKAMNLPRSVTSRAWGSGSEIGMRLYKVVIRPNMDYGCIVYGAASNATLRTLDEWLMKH